MLLAIGIAIFVVLLVIGGPIWLALGLAGGFLALMLMGLPPQSIPSQFFIAMDKWVLLAVPYFLLAGNLMTYMGPAKKMFAFVNSLIGHLPGGMPSAAIITAAIFGALSGSAVATVVAVGSMVIPQMIALGYSKEQSMGVVAVSGTLGQMIPPSIYMVLFASMVQMDVADLFLAGIVPGLFIALILIVIAIGLSVRDGVKRKEESSWEERGKSFLEAIPSLLMPIIVLGGIYSGIFTPTEAAAIAVLYVLIISFIFNRKDFTWYNLKKSLSGSMITTAVVFLILGGATLFSTALTFAQVPQHITEMALSINVPSSLIMILVLLLFFAFGTILDPVPILYITIPLIYPVVTALGFDPYHFGILTIACMMIAQVTPPVGVSLFALSGHFKENIGVIVKGSLPYLYGLIVATFLLLYIPWLSTFLL